MTAVVINPVTHHIWSIFNPDVRRVNAASYRLQTTWPRVKSDQLEKDAVIAVAREYNIMIVQGFLD